MRLERTYIKLKEGERDGLVVRKDLDQEKDRRTANAWGLPPVDIIAHISVVPLQLP